MFPASLEQYEAFIKTKMVDTRFFLFYEQDELLAVSVVDFLEQGLSAVYTFFDPDQSQRSLGNFAILWQIKKCQELGLPYLFLGYWIKGCGKMEYKTKFRPLEMLINGRWVLAK
jgi:arginine-tRNA-protein transferase